jgi:hypothetical protein
MHTFKTLNHEKKHENNELVPTHRREKTIFFLSKLESVYPLHCTYVLQRTFRESLTYVETFRHRRWKAAEVWFALGNYDL